jgi:hypothetical protein
MPEHWGWQIRLGISAVTVFGAGAWCWCAKGAAAGAPRKVEEVMIEQAAARVSSEGEWRGGIGDEGPL